MSSMFKKKGGPAFKPKIPSARARPAAPATSSQPSKPAQSQLSIDSQSQSQSQTTPQEQEKTSLSATPAVPSSELRSQEPSKPPRQKSPTSTPQELVSESVKSDNVASTEKPPSDKPDDSNTPSAITSKGSSGLAANVDEPITAPESTPVDSEPGQQTTSDDGIPPETSPIDSSNGSQTDTTPATEDATPKINVGHNDDNNENSAPEESRETTSQPTPIESTKPTTRPRTRRQVAKSSNAEGDEEAQSTPSKKRQRKTTQEATEDAPKPPRKRKTPNGNSQPRKRARSMTPEDSEAQVVDLQQLKMSDLTRDLHIGKKFSRHDELRERERRARLKSKLADGEPDDSATPEPGAAKTDSPAPPAEAAAEAAAPGDPAPASGPQFHIVDGQIVIDQSSLSVDRHARAAARLGDMETVEENDFTRLITSNSFMNTSKLKGPNIWTDSETELFYRGLRMFGTDFEMISKMFPGKQRRHVKLKYNREERHCPRRIDAAVMGEKTVKMDIDEYKAFTGTTFESVESIEAEQRKRQEDFEAEQKRIADEQAEVMRKKREELFAENDEDVAKKKKGGKKGKQKVVYGLNGEPIGAEA